MTPEAAGSCRVAVLLLNCSFLRPLLGGCVEFSDRSLTETREDMAAIHCLQASVDEPPVLKGENLTLNRRFSSYVRMTTYAKIKTHRRAYSYTTHSNSGGYIKLEVETYRKLSQILLGKLLTKL